MSANFTTAASLAPTTSTTTNTELVPSLPGYRIGGIRIPFTFTFASCVALIAGSVVINSLMVAGLRRDCRLKAVTYNYVTSLCYAMLMQTLLCFPPGVLQEIVGPGHTTLLNTLCIAWVYLDTFLCNLVFLHCLGSTIDTWLRLRYPMRYTYSTTRGSTCLKLGAPWSVGFIQTTAEFAISKQHENLFYASAGVCLHRDPNFVILRVCMSYALPGLAALLMLGLGFCQFSRVRGQHDPELVSELIRSYHKQQRSESPTAQSPRSLISCSSSVNGGGSLAAVVDLSTGHQLGGGAILDQPGCSSAHTLPRDGTRETLLLYPSSCSVPSTAAAAAASASTTASLTVGISRDAVSAFELCRMTPIPEAADESGSACNLMSSSRSCHTFKPQASSAGINGNNGGGGSSNNSGSSVLLTPSAYKTISSSETLHQQHHPSGLSGCPVHSATAHQLQLLHQQHQQQQHQQQQQLQNRLRNQLASEGFTSEDLEMTTEIPASAFAYDEQQHQRQQQQQDVNDLRRLQFQSQQQHQQQRQQRQRRLNNSWRRMLRSEKSACRLNLCAFLVSLVFWSPYTLSGLVHCVCANFPCPRGIPPSPANIGDMKWIAYASCLAYPVFFLFADADIRRAVGRAAVCRDPGGGAEDLVYGPASSPSECGGGELGEEDAESLTFGDSQA